MALNSLGSNTNFRTPDAVAKLAKVITNPGAVRFSCFPRTSLVKKCLEKPEEKLRTRGCSFRHVSTQVMTGSTYLPER